MLGLIRVNLVVSFVTAITLGIASPWMVFFRERWYAKHTILDGKQLTFDDTGAQLFGKYILWLLLSLVTLGIYSFWLHIKMHKWVISHTHVA